MASSVAGLPFPKLFPEHVACFSVRFPEDAGSFAGLSLPEELSRAILERQLEFLAGRHCAREALRALGCRHSEDAIPIGAGRAPCWPDGVVGSISHSGDRACAVATLTTHAASIGVDMQQLIDEAVAARVSKIVTDPIELQALMQISRLPYAVITAIVFSAKESILKCLYPIADADFDFSDFEITRIDIERECFAARVSNRLISNGDTFGGTIRIEDGFVYTGVMASHPRSNVRS